MRDFLHGILAAVTLLWAAVDAANSSWTTHAGMRRVFARLGLGRGTARGTLSSGTRRHHVYTRPRVLLQSAKSTEMQGETAPGVVEQCALPRKATTVLKWSLGSDKSKILKISVPPEALDSLKAIKGEVSVMSVVGPYRSGKSFLLNQILLNLVAPGFRPLLNPVLLNLATKPLTWRLNP